MSKTNRKYTSDFWDERYSQPDFVYGEKPNTYLESKLDTLPPGNILFPAEGEGRNAVYAAKSGWTVSAFDQSEAGNAKAELLADKNGVKIGYTVSDVESIRHPANSFDALALIYAHFHADDRRSYHRKLSNYLRKGGVLILEAFSKAQHLHQQENPASGGPRDPAMLYELEALKLDFEGFDFTECYETETVLNEGNHHVGKAAVVRIFATK